MKPLTEDGRSRELPDRLRLTARRTPSGLQALRSLLGLAAGPVSRTPSPEDKLFLEIAFAVASGCRDVAARKVDAARSAGLDRERLMTVLQLAVIAADRPVLTLAVDMLARFDAPPDQRRLTARRMILTSSGPARNAAPTPAMSAQIAGAGA